MANYGLCPLCAHYGLLTLHHAVWPRRKWQGKKIRDILVIYLCRECHDSVHQLHDQTRYKETSNMR